MLHPSCRKGWKILRGSISVVASLQKNECHCPRAMFHKGGTGREPRELSEILRD